MAMSGAGRSFHLGEFPLFEVVYRMGICHDSLFFKIADKSMASPGRDEVGDEKAVKEDTLGTYDHNAHEPTWFRQF